MYETPSVIVALTSEAFYFPERENMANPQMRVFVFSNYRSLNNGNLLLESSKILKQMTLNNKECYDLHTSKRYENIYHP